MTPLKMLFEALYYVGVTLLMFVLLVGLISLFPDDPRCRHNYQAWERLQESIADCREDPDCYLTLADRERVRDLAPRVAACEAREGEE